MSKPIVAIVGRPNVGKSTFFNRIVGRRISIVEDTPGVTRDRIFAEAEWNSVHFALIDTGGIEPSSADVILSQMREQAQIAMDMADVILFLTDGKEGLTHADREVANMLMRTGKNAVSQASEFGQVADITGIVLTKLDGTAKGGIAITIAEEFDMPIKFIGVGEGIEDLEEFVPETFIGGIFDE